ncbi:MAG: hypothetical protein HQL47_00935 [Gammaproteobacteria bacterium]|nr:hypothetical protein [Gammaproteobacteria bacterium]
MSELAASLPTQDPAAEELDETIGAITEVMTLFRAEMETIDKVAGKIANKTTRILKVVMVLLICVAIYLLFLIATMARDMHRMTTHLENMYVQFGSMSQDMQLITGLVLRMEDNVQGIREIAGHMQLLNNDMNGLIGSVSSMNGNMITMNGNIGLISQGTREMSHHFSNLTQNVDYMRHNVGVISSPARMLP